MNDYTRKYNSIYRGIIEVNDDPEYLGRCRVRVLAVHGDECSTQSIPWARPITIGPTSSTRGSIILPDVGDIVWVLFEGGYKDFPLYFGGTVGSNDIVTDPDSVVLYEDNNNRLVYYRDENQYEINVAGTSIIVREGEILLDAPKILVQGDLHVDGNIIRDDKKDMEVVYVTKE